MEFSKHRKIVDDCIHLLYQAAGCGPVEVIWIGNPLNAALASHSTRCYPVQFCLSTKNAAFSDTLDFIRYSMRERSGHSQSLGNARLRCERSGWIFKACLAEAGRFERACLRYLRMGDKLSPAYERVIQQFTQFSRYGYQSNIAELDEPQLTHELRDGFWPALEFSDWDGSGNSTLTPIDQALALLKQECLVCFFLETYCIVCPYPLDGESTVFHLHQEKQPTLRFEDGFPLFALEGISVPEALVLNPEPISDWDIVSEADRACRELMVKRCDRSHCLINATQRLVHQDDFGSLYRMDDLPEGDEEPVQMVKVVNATPDAQGNYEDCWLRVPPYIKTAREAVAWTFGFRKADDYQPLIET